jgi:hypothetical protein
MTNKIKKLCIGISLAASIALQPLPEARAGVGGIALLLGGTELLALAGGTGLATGLIGAHTVKDNEFLSVTFAIVAYIGLIILDEKNPHTLIYARLQEDEIALLGLTREEAAVFNSEIAEVNAVKASVAQELMKMENPSPEDASEMWGEFGHCLSPATMNVVNRISVTLQENLREQQ